MPKKLTSPMLVFVAGDFLTYGHFGKERLLKHAVQWGKKTMKTEN